MCTNALCHTGSEDLDIPVLEGLMLAPKTHPACTIHKDGMLQLLWFHQKKTKTHAQKSHQKVVKPRDLAGNAEEEDVEKTVVKCQMDFCGTK